METNTTTYTVDPVKIEANKQLRLQVEALLSLADIPPGREIRFWEYVQSAAATKLAALLPPPSQERNPLSSPMTQVEAFQFEQESIPFGQHLGDKVCTIEPSYLRWLAERPEDPFILNLRRYVQSRTFQARE